MLGHFKDRQGVSTRCGAFSHICIYTILIMIITMVYYTVLEIRKCSLFNGICFILIIKLVNLKLLSHLYFFKIDISVIIHAMDLCGLLRFFLREVHLTFFI